VTNSIYQVFKFVSNHQGFRASLGVISSQRNSKSVLAWGAIHKENGKTWVPELEKILVSCPDAQWTPMNQKQSSLFDQAYEREVNSGQEWLLSI
jgi:hypothetical protein